MAVGEADVNMIGVPVPVSGSGGAIARVGRRRDVQVAKANLTYRRDVDAQSSSGSAIAAVQRDARDGSHIDNLAETVERDAIGRGDTVGLKGRD